MCSKKSVFWSMLLFDRISAWHDAVLKEFYFEKNAGSNRWFLKALVRGRAGLKIILTVNSEVAFDLQQPSQLCFRFKTKSGPKKYSLVLLKSNTGPKKVLWHTTDGNQTWQMFKYKIFVVLLNDLEGLKQRLLAFVIRTWNFWVCNGHLQLIKNNF